MDHSPLICPLEDKQRLEISNQSEVVDYLADFVTHHRNRITESDLLAIHYLTIKDIYPCAGKFRTALNQVEITDTDHKPSAPYAVKNECWEMLEWLEGEGRERSPVHKATYVLWSTNAIHPFSGGNGRGARSLAYLVVVMHIAPIFAGEPLPSKLKARKTEYVQGLKAADRGNFEPLENLVLECVQSQIAEIAKGR